MNPRAGFSVRRDTSRLSTFGAYGAVLVLAQVLALASVFVERTGSETAPYGNMCGARVNEPCDQAVLKGGWPFAFLFDAPGISVEHQLTFAEDDVRAIAFAGDVVVYACAIALMMQTLEPKAADRRKSA